MNWSQSGLMSPMWVQVGRRPFEKIASGEILQLCDGVDMDYDEVLPSTYCSREDSQGHFMGVNQMIGTQINVAIGYSGQQCSTFQSGSWQQETLNFFQPLPLNEEAHQEQHTDQQLHRDLQKFLLGNRDLLNSLLDCTPTSMAEIRNVFELHQLQQRGLCHPRATLDEIFRGFKPVIGTPSIRQESDNRTAHGSSVILCPFRFCAGHFTRMAGLKNHISAHFSLTPQQCPRCGGCYSDAAIKRHVGNCCKASAKPGDHRGL
ncbi:hypothetical protein BDN70DRAFT_995543 [Pholiota conissans]|uniref:C2H2-type domain-containing protein n=1 Tax=Pholiota conissans TaxID=109636 RepID=A0A9P5YZB6_9AGAR|nr:hypothetical protein BDN70DRAFT_995543 [Pholiota conissans]